MHPLLKTKMRVFLYFLLSCVCITILTAEKTAGKPSQEPIALLLDKVIDGGSFLTGGNIIHLWGIEAPAKNDPYALAAKLYLETILKEASFSCHYKGKIAYKYYAMQCFSGQEDIASKLVRMGVARDLREESGGAYKEDESYAKDQAYGMWSIKNKSQ